MSYWLVKSEPGAYSFAQLTQDKKTAWTGVRNFQARNNLRLMKAGESVLYYHSGESKEVVGIAKVAKAAYPDPTAKEGDWSCVDLAPVRPLAQPVSLSTIKQDPTLRDMALVKFTRLSVLPVTEAHFNHILKLAGATR